MKFIQIHQLQKSICRMSYFKIYCQIEFNGLFYCRKNVKIKTPTINFFYNDFVFSMMFLIHAESEK